MKRVRLVALLAGLSVDFIGTILFVVGAFLLLRAFGGRAEAVLLNLTSTVSGLLAEYWIGLAFTLLGAYVTATLSKPNCMLNTFLFGLISTLLSLFFASWYPVWYTVLGVLTIIPAALAVGYVVTTRTV